MTSTAAVAGPSAEVDASLPRDLPASQVPVSPSGAQAPQPSIPSSTTVSNTDKPAYSHPHGGPTNTPQGLPNHHVPAAMAGEIKIPGSVDSVDSALLAALRDSRERLGLLKLEQVFIDFMNSEDDHWDVGGPYNSIVISPTRGVVSGNVEVPTIRPPTTFQRCILHRLADRFGITRDTRALDGYIRLWKQPDSKIPKKKLLDLDSSEYEAGQGGSLEDRMEGQLSISSNATLNAASKSSKPRKMKIMKRTSSNLSSNGSSDSMLARSNAAKSNKSISDKEKAYAEARARIFAEQGGGESGTKETASPIGALSAGLSANALPPPSTSSLSAAAPSFSIQDNLSSTSSLPPNEAEDAGPTSNRPSKATWRNRQSELNDPDFKRSAASAPAYYPVAYGYGANYHNPYMQQRPQRYYGQQQQQQYQSNASAPQIHSDEDFPSLR